ncbi:hypothetical protein [Carnobacterium inhibens]|uniref:hypothetical protein n=1 Tax=Carnobacterium inhibens TaxID=147709 RepID=UPI00203C9CB3|nr:hypothetical protein [Carnobacterium inhibens]MCM3513330.1 hypothetical protein [Carnobacterium inhibens]
MSKKTLLDIFKDFEVDSLEKAIYTITAWPSNRQFVGTVDLLNNCLLAIKETKGKKVINSYNDFKDFFEIINVLITQTFMNVESFMCDTGEVKFFSTNGFRDIFIGNGSEDIYEACFLIDEIVSGETYFESVWQEILDYENQIISKIYNREYLYEVEFGCPPEYFFNNVEKDFESFKNPKLKLFFSGFNSVNDELYPFFSNFNGNPIFLPLLKETFLEKIENELSKSFINNGVFRAIYRRLDSNFLSPMYKKNQYIYLINIFDNKTKESNFFEDSFAIWNENNIVVFLPSNLNEESIKIIKKGIQEKRFSFLGTSIGQEIVEVEFTSKMNIIIQRIDTTELSPNISKMLLFSHEEYSYMDAKGIIGIINNAENLGEIVDFVLFNLENRDRVMNASGLTAFFQTWKDMDKIINEGAEEISLFMLPYDSVNSTIYYFKEDLKNYPFVIDTTFQNVHFWKVIENSKSDLSLESKSGMSSVDVFRLNNKYLVYQEMHFIIEDIDTETLETITSFHEIIINGINMNKELILSLLIKNTLEINLVSESILQKNSKHHKIIESEYCKKIVINQSQDNQILLVRPYWKKIFESNLSCNTLEFENKLLISFLEGASFLDTDKLKNDIFLSNSSKRTSSVSKIEIPYYIEPYYTFSPPHNTSFKNVRKLMSKVIKDIGLEPGNYGEEEIVGLVRQFRNRIREGLQEKIRKFNTNELHEKLLNDYSAILFQIIVHKERLEQFNKETNLQNERLQIFRNEAIKLREESRTYKQVLEYLMEENLICSKTADEVPSNNQISELIAYSKWIMDFQLLSDSANYGAIGWHALVIREDYVLEIEETSKFESDAELQRNLKYAYGDFSKRNTNLDKQMIELVDKSFEKETGINFRSLVTTLTFLYTYQIVENFTKYDCVKKNINLIEVPIRFLASEFLKETELNVEEFYKVLDFVSVKVPEIADSSGVIPIWEKKKRKNKISAQPILVKEDKIVYSPVALYELEKDWIQGMMNFILPYNIGLEETTNKVDNWKDYYEDKIVRDLYQLFNENIYDLYMDKELYKLDEKGNHPKNLGDYDLIVINKEKNEILLFEVKYMRLSQTTKDSLGDQGKYFLNRKAKAKQFMRRIEYFETHIDKIMSNLGFEEKFGIKKYFLTNKNIRSFFKEYPFEVISFNEFKNRFFENM